MELTYFRLRFMSRNIVEHILKHCCKSLARHSQAISDIPFIGDIQPKSVKYFELTTGKDTKSGTKQVQ